MDCASLQAPPTVTVLIAAYNAEGFLRRAVLSALTQTVPVLEVLIVDDASTDGTAGVVKELAAADDRIRLESLPKNGGPSVARNAGLDRARGQWIVVLDADDAMLPDRLEGMLRVAAASEADIVVDNLRYYVPASNTAGPPVLEERDGGFEVVALQDFLSKARPLNPETDWGLLHPMFRRAFLDSKGLRYPIRSRHGEDFLLLVEAFLQGARYVLSRSAGYLYTGRESGLSRTTVNYPLMWEHTEALMSDPRIAGNALLVERLRERAAALKRLVTEKQLAAYWRERDYKAIAHRLLFDPGTRAVVRQKINRRLRNAVLSG
jgi:succinoglycan biosynthesis protein ExoO